MGFLSIDTFDLSSLIAKELLFGEATFVQNDLIDVCFFILISRYTHKKKDPMHEGLVVDIYSSKNSLNSEIGLVYESFFSKYR